MKFRALSIVVCLLAVAPLCSAQSDATRHDVTAVAASAASLTLPDEMLPARASDDACVSDVLERLLDGTTRPQPLSCDITCKKTADCPPPPGGCVGGCADRCCIYACPA